VLDGLPSKKKKVAEVSTAAATVDEHADVAVDGFDDAEPDFGPAIVQNSVKVV